MPRRLPPLNPMRAFEATARHGHVGRAAAELNVTHSAVSHQVGVFEAAVGVRLFDRQGRRLTLTQAGRRLQPSIKHALDLITEACSRALVPTMEGRLVIYAPPAFAAKWLMRRLGRFIETYRTIHLTILPYAPYESASRALADKSDVFIEYGTGHWEHKWVRLLSRVDLFPVCSPRLLNAKPLRVPNDLALHMLLHDDDGAAWASWLLANRVEGADCDRGLRFGNQNLTLDTAIYGHGVALGDNLNAAEDMTVGLLVKPFESSVPSTAHYYVVCDPESVKTPMVQTFVEWLLDEVGVSGRSFTREKVD